MKVINKPFPPWLCCLRLFLLTINNTIRNVQHIEYDIIINTADATEVPKRTKKLNFGVFVVGIGEVGELLKQCSEHVELWLTC